jgi:predicted MPP superfamily phosphohydrolase
VFASPTDMIEVGLKAPLHIREERVSHHPHTSRVVYISDIHLRKRRSGAISRQVLDAVHRCTPDLVLLGGDLVDGLSELPALSDLVDHIGGTAPVLAVGGNHDQRVGITRVADAVMAGGGSWIHERGARITHGDRTIAVAGPATAAPIAGDVRILCAHNPNVWKSSREAGYHLVLAGHLHGFQLVLGKYRDRLYPGALFYPYCFLSHQRGQSRLVVSRGVSDLLPVRWMCPREVVLCHV